MKAKSIYDGKRGKSRTIRPLVNAATVILLREGDMAPFEVFFMKRKPRQAFMGGAFVFPGGSLEAADMDPGLAAGLVSFSGERARCHLQEPDLSEETALGLFVAAIRETYEEAGVLLARDHEENPLTPQQSATLAAYRREVHDGILTLAALASRERFHYAPDLLRPYAHWVTPEGEPRRYDTRFFLALLPPGQSASHDRQELCDSRWLSPEKALSEQATGRIPLMPPTLKILEELNRFPSLADLWETTGKERIAIMLPEIFRSGDSVGIRLPTDPQYAGRGERLFPRLDETTRFVQQGGIWRSQARH